MEFDTPSLSDKNKRLLLIFSHETRQLRPIVSEIATDSTFARLGPCATDDYVQLER